MTYGSPESMDERLYDPTYLSDSGTSAGSPLRRLMVDLYVKAGAGSWNCSKHPEFLVDLWKALLERTLAQKTILDFRGQVLVAEDYVN
jgi:hypothetical protein